MSTRGLTAAHTAAAFETDLDAVVQRLRLQRFVLMGMSAFSVVALRYAARHPESVSGLILFNPPDGTGTTGPGSVESMRTLAEENWDLFLEVTSRTGFAYSDPRIVRPVYEAAINQTDWPHFRDSLRFELDEFIERLKLPTLILGVGGISSPAYPYEDSASVIAARIEGSRLVLDKVAPEVGRPVSHFISALQRSLFSPWRQQLLTSTAFQPGRSRCCA
jgi:pimeloyl-ACP methyl ester carboxylesterase